jgi:hypothetical protein
MWRVQTVPVPEPYLLGIAAGAWLQRVRAWRLLCVKSKSSSTGSGHYCGEVPRYLPTRRR